MKIQMKKNSSIFKNAAAESHVPVLKRKMAAREPKKVLRLLD
jgi:hypothetical protein